MSQITAENADEVLHHEPDYKLPICAQHGYAVRNLFDHLRDEHPIGIEEQRAIVKKYAQFELLEPSKVQLPPLGPPIQALGNPVKAFLCEEEERGFVSINNSVTRKHCNKAHDWRWNKEDPAH